MSLKRNTILAIMVLFKAATALADTIFTEKPDFRKWDPKYAVEVFVDDFSGSSLDESKWNVATCQGGGINNDLLTSNQRENVIVEDGLLKLIARHETTTNTECWSGSFTSDYTTAAIYSKRPPHSYLYGVFEARCRMPRGRGLWPAFWLWGPGTDKDGFPHDGYSSEIDVAEEIMIRGRRAFIHAFHYWVPDSDYAQMDINDGEMNFGLKYLEEWHTLTVVWSPWEVRFYIDGEKSWERSHFYTGETDNWRNDVFSEDIVPGQSYKEHQWFPRHKCEIHLQMVLREIVERRVRRLLPAVMEVDYVRIRQFFLAPEISCRDTIYSSCVANLDVDDKATDIHWEIIPHEQQDLFSGPTSGNGTEALIIPSGRGEGKGMVKFTFQMPSGESFTAEKVFEIIPTF